MAEWTRSWHKEPDTTFTEHLMPAIAIIVEFEALEGQENAFLRLIREHAAKTVAEEPGCLRFEVIKPVERDGTSVPNRVMVNELYESWDAVSAHEANPRMPGLREALGPLLKSRRLIHAEVVQGS